MVAKSVDRKKLKKKTQTKKLSAARADVTGLMTRIESMSNELALLQRVAELESQLATIRKALN
jgi:hypothetical protein